MSLRQRRLTARELEVVECVRLGLQNKEIAHRLGIAEGTVKIHLHTVFNKTGYKNRVQLALINTRRWHD